jgi:Xaa-Pro dipeptidase
MLVKDAVLGLEKELAFSAEEYQSRVRKVRQIMKERGVEVLVAHHPLNVLYLSGFQSINMYDSECVIVPQEGDITLLVPERELGNALLQSWVEQTHTFARTEYPDITFRQPMQALATLLGNQHLESARIGIEQRSPAVSSQKFETLKTLLPKAVVVEGSGIVESVRATKSFQEIAHLRRAASMTNLSMEAAIDAAADGKSDNAVAAAA